MQDEREKRDASEPDEALREATEPDADRLGDALAEAIKSPDYRTKTGSPSTSERRLSDDELPGPEDGTQG
jgi:hypothetical protein